MLKTLVVILSLVVFTPAQNCQNPGWGERCSTTFNDCVSSTSEGEGCSIAGDGCENCYRGDLLLSGFANPNADYTVGQLVYINPKAQGWRITKLGRLATDKNVQVGDIIVRIAGQPVNRTRLLRHFSAPRTRSYSIDVFKVGTGRTQSLRIG